MHKFFKWIKQHLKIKKFWGTSENAVRIQIYSAIIAYCMMAIVQKKMNIERSIYEMLQIVSISLTDTTNLKDLFLIVRLYNNRPELLPDSNAYGTQSFIRFRFTYIYQGMTHQVGMVLPQRTLYQSHLSLLSDYLQGLRFFGRNLLRDTET